MRLIGIKDQLVGQYIEFVANRLLVEMISMRTNVNFFETRVWEYQKAGVMASLVTNPEVNFTFTTDEGL